MSMKWTSDVEDSVTGKAPTTLGGKIAVMQAYGRGELIHARFKGRDDLNWCAIDPPCWNWERLDFCIAPKPEPQAEEYRPYTHDELVGMLGTRIKLKKDNDNTVYLITSVIGNEALVGRFYTCSEELLRNFAWMDGSPLGVLVED